MFMIRNSLYLCSQQVLYKCLIDYLPQLLTHWVSAGSQAHSAFTTDAAKEATTAVMKRPFMVMLYLMFTMNE